MVTKIVLNAEQTKRFLSFFVQEAIQIAKQRAEAQKATAQQAQAVQSGS